jgi:hypothetical protein
MAVGDPFLPVGFLQSGLTRGDGSFVFRFHEAAVRDLPQPARNGRLTNLGEGQSSVSNVPVKRRLQSTLARSARFAAHLLQAGLVLMIAHTKIV